LSKSKSSQKYKAIIAYDGTDFYGFQRQGDRRRTVQSVIEDSLKHLGWDRPTIWAAGRTDAGVHASGQVIAFELDWKHSASELRRAINSNLPPDTVAKSIEEATPEFHPRYDANSRTYLYRYLASQVADPLRSRYVYLVWPEPSLRRMMDAVKVMIGEHDFSGFGAPTRPGGGTTRIIFSAEARTQKDEIRFRIEANSFLYRMVRKLAEALLEIGQGKLDVNDLENYLEEPKAKWTGRISPARGLCLEQVSYRE
jgi:tRNA pseudouridine38-40 synthase